MRRHGGRALEYPYSPRRRRRLYPFRRRQLYHLRPHSPPRLVRRNRDRSAARQCERIWKQRFVHLHDCIRLSPSELTHSFPSQGTKAPRCSGAARVPPADLRPPTHRAPKSASNAEPFRSFSDPTGLPTGPKRPLGTATRSTGSWSKSRRWPMCRNRKRPCRRRFSPNASTRTCTTSIRRGDPASPKSGGKTRLLRPKIGHSDGSSRATRSSSWACRARRAELPNQTSSKCIISRPFIYSILPSTTCAINTRRYPVNILVV